MSLLIEEHDIFMFLTLKDNGNPHHRVLNEGILREYISKYDNIGDGEKLLGELIMVGRADNKSQNPQLTHDSLRLLDKFDELLQSNGQRNK